jgi:hypothetical protein
LVKERLIQDRSTSAFACADSGSLGALLRFARAGEGALKRCIPKGCEKKWLALTTKPGIGTSLVDRQPMGLRGIGRFGIETHAAEKGTASLQGFYARRAILCNRLPAECTEDE